MAPPDEKEGAALTTLSAEDLRDAAGGAGPEAAPSRARRRGRGEPPARRPELAHLTLTALRAYRTELMGEETRVSYWRRLVQARLDLLLAEGLREDDSVGEALHPLERLRQVLSDPVTAHRREALLGLCTGAEMPPLPDLADLWACTPVPGQGVNGRLLERLADAERALSAYRRALHARIDVATADLVARYAEDPGRCLVALPLPRTERPAPAR